MKYNSETYGMKASEMDGIKYLTIEGIGYMTKHNNGKPVMTFIPSTIGLDHLSLIKQMMMGFDGFFEAVKHMNETGETMYSPFKEQSQAEARHE